MKSRHRTKRAREIIGVFLKYGVRSAADPALMRLAFEELGPTFVKIGQILSTRPDILPDSYIREFRRLQDDVRPEKFEDIRRVIEDDLHAPLDKLFTEFDEKAAASASLAEVHRARLPDGRGVLIKVQRPRARETMTEDIAILKSLSRLLGFLPLTNIISFSDMMQEIEQTARQELDFLNEAENIRKFRENNSGVRYITCPGVYDAYTTSNVLVMDYIDGISIGNAEALQKEGYDLSDMGTKLVRNYFRQVFEDGFFHADPHPGNILIAENKIAYIDFGIMGSISHGMQEKFNSFLFGIATNDVDAMTKAILRIGVRKNSTDTDLLYEDVGELYNKYISASLNDINVREIISEVFNVCKKNSISMPREMTMLGKGMITIEGVVARIAPEINVMGLAVDYAKRRVLSHKTGKQDMLEQLESLYMLFSTGAKIPAKMLEFVNSALAGRLKVKMDYSHQDEIFERLNRMVNRIVFSLILASLIIGSSLILFSNAGPKLHGVSLVGLAGYAGAAVIGFWLLISIIRSNRL